MELFKAILDNKQFFLCKFHEWPLRGEFLYSLAFMQSKF